MAQQEDPIRSAWAPSWVSINTFDTGNIPRGSKSLVPSEIPPEYQTLTSFLTGSSDSCTTTNFHKSTLEFVECSRNLAQNLVWHWPRPSHISRGTDNLCHLWEINRIDYPQFYSDLSDAVDEIHCQDSQKTETVRERRKPPTSSLPWANPTQTTQSRLKTQSNPQTGYGPCHSRMMTSGSNSWTWK